jgi:hypothetical protein
VCLISNAHGQADYCEGRLYWAETTGNSVDDLPGTAWIRLSTGKLCLDIGNGVNSCSEVRFNLLFHTPAELPSFKLMEDELHAKLLCVLKFHEFYAMFAFSRQYFGYNLPSSKESITLPSIWTPGDWADFKSDQLLAIPFPNHATPNEIYMQPWGGYPLQNEGMPTGWTRWVSELLWTIILMEAIARVEYQDNVESGIVTRRLLREPRRHIRYLALCPLAYPPLCPLCAYIFYLIDVSCSILVSPRRSSTSLEYILDC